MDVHRVYERPRVSMPHTDEQWNELLAAGDAVDAKLFANDVRLTMGGEPTFVSIDDMEGHEWNYGAVGQKKRELSDKLVRRLSDRFATGALLHFGQGKWYPGEPLPRWAYGCYWRKDGKPIWHDRSLIAETSRDDGLGAEEAKRFIDRLAASIGVDERYVVPAYEDAMYHAWKENTLPPNVKAGESRALNELDRKALMRVFDEGVDTPRGYVMPLQQQWWQGGAKRWATGHWPVRREQMFLLPGDSPMGLRLPLASLSEVPKGQVPVPIASDPTVERGALPDPILARTGWLSGDGSGVSDESDEAVIAGTADGNAKLLRRRRKRSQAEPAERPVMLFDAPPLIAEAPHVVRTALCVEPREGRLHVFMPPVDTLEEYLDLVGAVEATAAALSMPVMIEGYLPPSDPRLEVLKVTPDPGVIEVNTHPVGTWDDLVESTTALYEEARLTRLGTEKFDLDGKHTGTGGGNHVVMGGKTPSDSPFLRRPDLLASVLRYWLNHPSLSYVFSGRFIGPTSQAPRVDEGRADATYELELALKTLDAHEGSPPPWLVDRVFRHLLTDLTGN
ncbi:MAG: transglutaminase family protein, partial [Phycisphaeraceae bacterium]